MNAYLPHHPAAAALAGAALAAALLAAFAVSRMPPGRAARLLAWGLLAAAVAAVERLCAGEPAGLRMLAIIAALFLGMKAIVSVEDRAERGTCLGAWRWFAFAVTWPGMRPGLFQAAGGPPLPGAAPLIAAGLGRLFLGLALALLARLAWAEGRPLLGPLPACVLATALLLTGLALMVFFGVFNVLAGLWRLAGVDCRRLFRAPLAAGSLSEFWGQRWNLAFSEMVALGIYRPLSGVLGRKAATMGAFLFSGVVHELAVSLPVLAGFGLPLAYFALHGGLVLFERRREALRLPVSGWGWPAHAWTLGWLALPLPALFHPWFLRGAVWPLIGIDIPV
jgi:hypothetical protein